MDHSFLKTKKIMLVDDESDLLEMVKTILQDDGFQNIVTAVSVKDGIRVCKNEQPDLPFWILCFRMGMGIFSCSRCVNLQMCLLFS